MKIETRRITATLREFGRDQGRDQGTMRCVLLWGDDLGLIRERADLVAATVVPQRDDPFRVAWLDRDTADRLADEAGALSMTGGRRVVRVRDADDRILPALQAALRVGGDTLLVIEAPELPTRGKLRAFADKDAAVASIGCYPDDGRTLADTLRGLLAAENISADADAMAYLTRVLGADRALTASEIGKLALYTGPGGRVSLEDAEACIGDAAALSVDDALHDATAGNVAGSDRAMGLALAEGAASVAVLRAAQNHLHRLRQARLAMDAGAPAADAVRGLRPPLFFRRTDIFQRALSVWSSSGLLRAADAMAQAEAGCKRTGAPDAVLCREAIATLARAASAMARRGRAAN